MTINAIKFGTLISYISHRTDKVFSYYDCEEISNMIVDVTAVDVQKVDDLMVQMYAGTSKIEAIKAYRALTNLGLNESKDAVEKYWTDKRND